MTMQPYQRVILILLVAGAMIGSVAGLFLYLAIASQNLITLTFMMICLVGLLLLINVFQSSSYEKRIAKLSSMLDALQTSSASKTVGARVKRNYF